MYLPRKECGGSTVYGIYACFTRWSDGFQFMLHSSTKFHWLSGLANNENHVYNSYLVSEIC
jgi:hypothetical protein